MCATYMQRFPEYSDKPLCLSKIDVEHKITTANKEFYELIEYPLASASDSSWEANSSAEVVQKPYGARTSTATNKLARKPSDIEFNGTFKRKLIGALTSPLNILACNACVHASPIRRFAI